MSLIAFESAITFSGGGFNTANRSPSHVLERTNCLQTLDNKTVKPFRTFGMIAVALDKHLKRGNI